MAGILKVDKYQDFNGNDIMTSDGSGNITVNAAISGQNYPAFQALLSADQTVTDDVTTKVQFNTEDLDTDNCYDNSTNYRFTPTVAGKYFVYSGLELKGGSGNTLEYVILDIKKNDTTNNIRIINNPADNQAAGIVNYASSIIDMNGSTDFIEIYATITVSSGSGIVEAGSRNSYFGAYRIGA
jgi:hypothetical protein